MLKKAKRKRRSRKVPVADRNSWNKASAGARTKEDLKMTQALTVGRRAMARPVVLAILALVLAPGCMSQQLQFTTRQTVNALPDLQYEQVIDNLAKIASNPGFLPYLAIAGQGSVQVTDNGNSTLGLNMPAAIFGPGNPIFGASRDVTGTWSLGTITSPEKVRSMQAVYLRAIRGRAAGDPAFGWLKIGGKGDVPKQVSYVGRFEDVYVWVMPEGMTGLSDLTLAIMDIATSEDSGGAPVSEGERLRGAAGPAGGMRRNFQVPAVGPVFTPSGH
jgi:hypothetical protein